MFCKNCGAELAPESRFCAKCGAAKMTEAPVAETIPSEDATSQEEATSSEETTPPEQTADVPVVVPAVEAPPEAPAEKEATFAETSDAPKEEATPSEEATPPEQATDVPVVVPAAETSDTSAEQTTQSAEATSAPTPTAEPAQPQDQPYQPQPYQQQPYQPQPYQQNQQQQPYDPAQPYQQYPPYAQPYPVEPEVKKRKLWKIIVPVASAVVILTIAAIFLAMFINSPLRIAASSISNLGDEFDQRIEDTPLEMFGMLSDSLTDGSVTVAFDYTTFMADMSGAITLHSDEEHGEYAIEAAMAIYGLEFDLDMHFNSESVAARISQIDDNFYGIVFETFWDDFRSFSNLLGLTRQEVDEITDAIEAYERWISALEDANEHDMAATYRQFFTNIVNRMEIDSNRVDFKLDGENVSVRKIDFIMSAELLVEVLEDYIDAMEANEYGRAVFEATNAFTAAIDPWTEPMTFEDMIDELRSEIRYLEDMEGDMVLSMYVGRGDRLLRMELNVDFEYNRDRMELNIAMDFGASADDTWTLEIDARGDWGLSEIAFTWDVNETARGGETALSVTTEDRWGVSTDSIILEWTDRGNISFLYEVNGRGRETIFSGTYTSDDYGFTLTLEDLIEDLLFFEQNLDIEISTARRTERLEPVEFINVSDWGQSLIDMVEDFFSLENMFFDLGLLPDDFPELIPDPLPDVSIQQPDGTQVDLSDHELVGFWEFYEGRATWFFWTSDVVWFVDDGTVYSDHDIGVWTVDGNRLTVVDNHGDGRTFEFYFEIVDGVLAITDVDDDTGYFIALW